MNDIYNKDFRSIVNHLGEPITFEYNRQEYTVPASLKQSTRQVYNLAPREFYFEGQTAYTYDGVNRIKAGDYFVRKSVPDYRKYYVASLVPETYSNDLGYIFCIQCNANITLARIETIETESNFIDKEVIYADSIEAYFTTIPRSYQRLNDGNLDQTIYTALIPAKYQVCVEDRLKKRNFIYYKDSKEVSFSYVSYRIESIDTALMTYDNNTQEVSGIIQVQMTEDLRAVNG